MSRLWLPLHPHPQHPPPDGCAVAVAIDWQTDARLRFRFRVTGAAMLRLSPQPPLPTLPAPPRPAAPRRTDGLWRHTCLEAFVAGAGTRYHEFNFAPSCHWAAYAFADYRQPEGVPVDGLCALDTPGGDPLHIATQYDGDGDTLQLDASVPHAALPPPGDGWRLGLSAVLEDHHGTLSYWALHHPAERPDFHRAEAFRLPLPPAPEALRNPETP